MWLLKRSDRPSPSSTTFTTADEVRCTAPLVLHADGTAACENAHDCGGDELVHEWSLPCHELGCGCTGEEHDLVLSFAAAA